MIQYEIKISGRVQGVGFRYFVYHKAKEFGLKGWVKNSVDGGVLVMVQCDTTEIDIFIDYLRIGPIRSRVDKISKHKMELLVDFDNFSIKY